MGERQYEKRVQGESTRREYEERLLASQESLQLSGPALAQPDYVRPTGQPLVLAPATALRMDLS